MSKQQFIHGSCLAEAAFLIKNIDIATLLVSVRSYELHLITPASVGLKLQIILCF